MRHTLNRCDKQRADDFTSVQLHRGVRQVDSTLNAHTATLDALKGCRTKIPPHQKPLNIPKTHLLKITSFWSVRDIHGILSTQRKDQCSDPDFV